MPVITINILIICATIVALALIGSRAPRREKKRDDNHHTEQ
mgnify:CR=1 FL=1